MAKKFNGLQFTGTIDNVCVYEMFGKIYARKKSSLTRKRVLKSREFKKTRQYASDLGRAAQIGSEIYQALPINIRERWLYRAITGEAASLLYEGKNEQQVRDILWEKYIHNTGCRKDRSHTKTFYHSTPESTRLLRKVFLERWEAQELSYYYFKRAWQNRGYFNPQRFREVMETMNRSARGR
jgi:hypothetical protein